MQLRLSQDISVGICADIITHTGFEDRFSSTVALYVDTSTVCGFFLSWKGAPPQYRERSVWGRVGFYMIHTFLNPSVESQFKSFLKLIIPFWYQHNTITFQLYKSHLLSLRGSMLLSLHTVSRLAWGLSAPQICLPRNPNICQQSWIYETLWENNNNRKMRNTNQTSVSTKSFVKNLLQTPRFKTMISNTFTANSA